MTPPRRRPASLLQQEPAEAAVEAPSQSHGVTSLRGVEAGVVSVRICESLQPPIPDEVIATIEKAATFGDIILDLGEEPVVDRNLNVGLVGLVAGVAGPDHFCVVCARGTGRRLLQQWGISRCAAIFGTVRDALQARRHAIEGYGDGWIARTRP